MVMEVMVHANELHVRNSNTDRILCKSARFVTAERLDFFPQSTNTMGDAVIRLIRCFRSDPRTTQDLLLAIEPFEEYQLRLAVSQI